MRGLVRAWNWLSRLARRDSRLGTSGVRGCCCSRSACLAHLAIRRPLEELRLRSLRSLPGLQAARRRQQRPVVIVDIDEESLRKLGQWPWPRTLVADLVDAADQARRRRHRLRRDLRRAGPDVARRSQRTTFRDLDEETRTKLRALPSNDEVLADAIKQSRVVLGRNRLAGRGAANRTRRRPRPASPRWAAIRRRFLVTFPGPAAQRPGARTGRRRARPVQHSHRARRHRAPRADGDAGAGHDHARRSRFEMLRVVTECQRHPDPHGRGRRQERRGARAGDADRPQRPALGPFRAARPGALRVRHRRARRPRHRRPMSRGRLVLIGTSAAGLLDLKTTPIDPTMPGVEVHAQVLESMLTQRRAVAAELGDRRRACWQRFVIGHRHHLARADARRRPLLLLFGAIVIALLVGASWYLFSQHKTADRFHLSAVVEPADLPDAGVHQLSSASRRSGADPLGLRPVSVAGAGRAARAIAGEARARRRRARHDDHVQRRARLHHDFGDLQGRSAGADGADEQLPDAADQRHHRSQGHHRQIHGRRDHGVLERAARRPDPRTQRLRGRARHARARGRAQSRARGEARRERRSRSSRSTSASASTPAAAWSATWAPTCASTIRCWATASIWRPGWKANANPTACRSSSARGPRAPPRTSSRSSNSTSSR